MNTQSSSTRTLKPAQEQEVAEDRRRPITRQSSTCGRDFGIKERESEGREVVLGTLSNSEGQATLQWKSTRERGAETPEERETRKESSAVRHFERGDEDVTE